LSNRFTILNILDNWTIIYYNSANWHNNDRESDIMIIKTRVFEMANGKYHNLSDLARAMGISVSQVYRVREGKRGINEKFIVGAKKAFPDSRLDELFYFNSGHPSGNVAEATATGRYNHIVQRFNTAVF
jgi:hypothetical protein